MPQDPKANSNTSSRLETAIETDTVVSADVGIASPSAGGDVRTTNTDATSYEFRGDGKKPGEEAEKPGAEGEAPAEGVEANEPAGEAEEDLGEWKRDDPDSQAKFEARYFKDGGELNRDALSKEFWESHAKDPKTAGLKPTTYEFLKDTLGIGKEMVKEVEAALVIQASTVAETFYKTVGGKERFEQAVTWGRDGGYTPAQRERFNKARDAGGVEFEEAVEALMSRFNRAHPQPQQQQRRGPPQQQRRQSSPERTATSGGAAGGAPEGQGFKSREEYLEVWQKALAEEKAAKPGEEKRTARKKLDDLRRRARQHRFA